MAYIGKQPTVGNFVKLDSITTSATATYNLLNGGVAYSPQSANHCIVSLNGVIQEPTSASNVGGFTISGSTIVFTSALTATDVIDFILVLGDVLNIGTPSDATVGFSKVTSNLITGATAETSIAGGDSVLIYDDSASALRKMTRTNFVSGIGGTNTPAFLATRDSSFSLTSATWTKIPFSTEVFDTNSNYDPTTNFRFTPTTSGKYFLKVACNVFANSSNITDARIAIYKNGSVLIHSYNFIVVSNQDLRHIDVTTSIIDSANGSSDYYEGYVNVTGTTVSVAFDASVTNGNNFFGYKIIE